MCSYPAHPRHYTARIWSAKKAKLCPCELYFIIPFSDTDLTLNQGSKFHFVSTSFTVNRVHSRVLHHCKGLLCRDECFSSALFCFNNCRIRINTLIYLSPPNVYEQCFGEEIRQKAFKSHINLKLASALLCSLYFYVANLKNFTTFVFEVIG